MNDAKENKIVEIGSWVKFREVDSPVEEIIQLVQPTQANLMEDKIPPDNAMAQALLGSHPGDKVAYHAPAGKIELVILDVGKDAPS